MIMMDILALLAAGVCYIFIGSHWITVTLAILGCSLFSTIQYMICPRSKHHKAQEKTESSSGNDTKNNPRSFLKLIQPK